MKYVLVGLSCLVIPLSSAQAATIFFGEDLFTSGSVPIDGNAAEAERDFRERLTTSGTESFESGFFNNQRVNGTTLSFAGSIEPTTATVQDAQNAAILSAPSGGRFATSGDFFVDTVREGFTLSFDRDVDAFGFYMTDFGEIDSQISVSTSGGLSQTFTIPHSASASDADILYWGVVADDPTETFGSVTFGGNISPEGNEDFLGLDDVTVGNVGDGDPTIDPPPFDDTDAMPASQTLPIVFLDFDGGVGAFFEKLPVSLPGVPTGSEQYVVSDGAIAASAISQVDRDAVQEEIEDLFSDAGIDLHVTQTAPSDTASSVVQVEFGLGLPAFDGDGDGEPAFLAGHAYDITALPNFGAELGGFSFGNYGIDRFNRSANGTVAVFLDTADGYSPKEIAETAAHEIGHSYGLFHIDPLEEGTEVLDYTPVLEDQHEEFYDQPASLAFFGSSRTDNRTHNPTYHLRRFVNEETVEQLTTSDPDLIAGSWDQTAFDIFSAQIELGTLATSASQWYLAHRNYTMLVRGDDDFSSIYFLDITNDIYQGGLVTMLVDEFAEFSLVGSSDGISLDTYLSSSAGMFELLSLNELGQDGIGFYRATNNELSLLGNVGIGTRLYETALPQPALIPLPATLPLCALGLITLPLIRRKPVNQKAEAKE